MTTTRRAYQKAEDPSLTRQRPKNHTTKAARARKRRASERIKQAVYAAVDLRDNYRCRVCRTMLYGPFGPVHHHHLQYRSKGGKHTTENVISLCAICHQAVHDKELYLHGANANSLMTAEWK